MKLVQTISVLAVPAVFSAIILFGLFRHVKVYDCFIKGAADGLKTAFRIVPPIIGLMVAVSMLRASGALEIFAVILRPLTGLIGMPDDLLPLALLRPVSGGGSIGVLTDLVARFGPDSLIGRIASVMMGSTETTFYTLTVYFGSIGIKKTRHALPSAIFADIVTICVSVMVCRLFFA